MSKVRPQQIDPKQRQKAIGELFDLVAQLDSKNDVIGFLMGLLSSSESLMLGRRLQIAQMLLAGKTIEEIRLKLGVGISTISNVSWWLYGENIILKKTNYRTHGAKENT